MEQLVCPARSAAAVWAANAMLAQACCAPRLSCLGSPAWDLDPSLNLYLASQQGAAQLWQLTASQADGLPIRNCTEPTRVFWRSQQRSYCNNQFIN